MRIEATGGAHVNGPWPEGSEEAHALCVRIAGDEIDVPAAARARVLRKLSAERARTVWWRAAWLAPATAVALGAAAWVSRPADDPRARHGEQHLSARAARAENFPGLARLVLGDDTEATLVRSSDGATLRIARGSVLGQVEPQRLDAPFRVVTPNAEVRVVGTVLYVAVGAGPDPRSAVAVAHGVVEVSSTGAPTVRVAAGQHWPAQPAVRSIPTEVELGLLGPPEAPLDFGAPEPPVAAPAAPAPGTVIPGEAARAATIRGPHDPVCRSRSGRDAERCLAMLAHGRDPLRAETALFELGWRRENEQGGVAGARGALAAWTEQRRRFPSGALREDADVSIVGALGRLRAAASDHRLDRRLRTELDRYLAAHPAGMAAPEMHYLRGDLSLRLGDCAAARRDLAIALRAPADPWAAAARDGLARCGAGSTKPRTE